MRKRLTSHIHKELLSRALGLKKWRNEEMLVDLTAGLGMDAFVVAYSGHKVIAIERHDVIEQLLRNGLQRARAGVAGLAASAERISLLHQDARQYLRGDHPDDHRVRAMYLDPMFAPRKKSALGNHKLRALLAISGHDEDANILLECALQRARQLPCCERVVVKRRLRAPQLHSDSAPSHQIVGRVVRFDVYMCLS